MFRGMSPYNPTVERQRVSSGFLPLSLLSLGKRRGKKKDVRRELKAHSMRRIPLTEKTVETGVSRSKSWSKEIESPPSVEDDSRIL